MKTSVMKKSLLDYAIKGFLSTRFRRENPNLNALSEIESYNTQILKDKQAKEKELKNLESTLKKEITKLKIITPLTCHSEALAEESQNKVSLENKTSLKDSNLSFSQKGVYPHPAPLVCRKRRRFFGKQGESLAISASSPKSERGHYCLAYFRF